MGVEEIGVQDDADDFSGKEKPTESAIPAQGSR